MQRWKRALVAVAVLAVAGCGDVPIPSANAALPIPVATPRPPVAVLGTIQPLGCESAVKGIFDFMSGATGVSDIVSETLTTQAVAHEPNDQIVVDGDRTAIVRDGQTVYIAEWRRADDGSWLLGQYTACEAFIPESLEPEE